MQNILDCIIIGYNEIPFPAYLSSVKAYGESSEGYKDLRPNFFMIREKPVTYVDLLNSVSNNNFLSCDIPNLAAVYLSNFLKKRELNVEFINLFQQEKERLRQLINCRPLCIAITTTFYVTTQPVIEMVEYIKQINSEIPIVIGGVLISNLFNTYTQDEFLFVLSEIAADMYILESQGELTLYNLVKALKESKDLSSIPNLIYFEKGDFVINNRLHENNSLDEEAIDWSNFKNYDLGTTLQTRTARSCAFACAFCGYPERGGTLTSAKIETIANELDSISRLGQVKNLVFIDDTFNVPKGRFRELCQMLIDRQYNFDWFSYYRCDHGDEETIKLMSKSGCKGVFLGIESGSQLILENMNKRAKITNYKKGIEHLKQNGILTFASFITGYPGETKETILETIDFIKTNKPDYWRSMLWYCDPLTPVYKTKKAEFKLAGEGFKWSHFTMTSTEAADHLLELFLQIDPAESIWMPQYSFDFWIIPYLLGKGITRLQFNRFMYLANQAMILEIGEKRLSAKHQKQEIIFNDMKKLFQKSLAV